MNISFKKFLASCTGPGGMKCPCCAPAPRHKKRFVRACKKKFNKVVDKFVNEGWD